MKCSECQKEGLSSTVQVGPTISTCMGFTAYYDEAGKRHSHDPNDLYTTYECSNGHKWGVSRQAPCPQSDCFWNKGIESEA